MGLAAADRAARVPPARTPRVSKQRYAYMVANLLFRKRLHDPTTIGRPALLAVLGQKVSPGLVDRYLARVGYEGQQTGNAERPERADNLYEPGPGDPGADGPFVDEATNRSPQLWIRTHATQLALGIAGAGAAAGGLAARRS